MCEYKTVFSGLYPDGSKIKTELCNSCGNTILTLRRAAEPVEQTYTLEAPVAVEVAYALLKSLTRFQHQNEHQVQEVVTGL